MYSGDIRQYFNDKNKNKVFQYPKSVDLLKEIESLGLKEEDLPERNITYRYVAMNHTFRLFQNMGEHFGDEEMIDAFKLEKYKPYFDDFKSPIRLDEFIEKIATLPCYEDGDTQKFKQIKKEVTIQMKRKKRDNYPLVIYWKEDDKVPEIFEFLEETDFDYLNRIKYINDLTD